MHTNMHTHAHLDGFKFYLGNIMEKGCLKVTKPIRSILKITKELELSRVPVHVMNNQWRVKAVLNVTRFTKGVTGEQKDNGVEQHTDSYKWTIATYASVPVPTDSPILFCSPLVQSAPAESRRFTGAYCKRKKPNWIGRSNLIFLFAISSS